jgi:hypothetical protein
MGKRKKITAAIDVLKAAISKDRCAMVVVEKRFGREVDGTVERKLQGLAELALDILCGEQPI